MPGLFDGARRRLGFRRLYMLLVAAGLCALLGVVLSDAQGTLAWWNVPAATPPATAGRSLTSGPVMDGFGAWAPDGRQIAFMRDGQIWLVAAAGGTPKQLTGSQGMWDATPAWRPDGKAVAYARTVVGSPAPDGAQAVQASGGAYLMAVDPATGKEQQLGKESEAVGHVAWDPTGRALYYSTARRLMKLDVRTGRATQLWKAKADDWEQLAGGLAVSPDGKVLVFGGGQQLGRAVAYDLWVLPLSGRANEPKRLTSGGGIMPSFDASGSRIVYRNPRMESGIYVLDMKTHALKSVLPDEGNALFFHPMLSPDGKQLLVSKLLLDPPGGPRPDGRFTSHLHLHTLSGSGGD